MFNWLYKWMGYHVCEEFTQWERREDRVLAGILDDDPVKARGGLKIDSRNYPPTWRIRWQERRFTMCGKIEQIPLKQ